MTTNVNSQKQVHQHKKIVHRTYKARYIEKFLYFFIKPRIFIEIYFNCCYRSWLIYQLCFKLLHQKGIKVRKTKSSQTLLKNSAIKQLYFMLATMIPVEPLEKHDNSMTRKS